MENDFKSLERSRKGKTVVFVNGCFDLFHSGHLALLSYAKSQGDILVVGVNSDLSVQNNKSPCRPIIPQKDRLLIVKSLKCVDFAFLFEEKDPRFLIEYIRPDIIVKGSDYRNVNIEEQRSIEKCNCKILWFERIDGISTTEIIKKIVSFDNQVL